MCNCSTVKLWQGPEEMDDSVEFRSPKPTYKQGRHGDPSVIPAFKRKTPLVEQVAWLD